MDFISENYLCDSESGFTRQTLKHKQHYIVQQNMFMTQQSQRPQSHATVVSLAGPSRETYVRQSQCAEWQKAVVPSFCPESPSSRRLLPARGRA